MDNHGTPAPINSQIRQNRDALFPNRRGTQNVEDHEPSASRRVIEAEILVDENNREFLGFTTTPIVIPDDSDDDAAYEEAVRKRKGKMVAVSVEPEEKGNAVARKIPSGILIREPQNEEFIQHESETDSEDDAEYQRKLNVTKLESLNTFNMEAPEYYRSCFLTTSEAQRRRKRKSADDILLVDEDQRQIDAVIWDLWNGNNNNSAGCPNKDIIDEGAQTEALDAFRDYKLVCNGNSTRSESETDKGNESSKGKRKTKAKKTKMVEREVARGNFINSPRDTEPTSSMPRQRVSSRGRPLKPTRKQIQVSNAADAPTVEGTSGSKKKQPKRERFNNVIARSRSMPRLPVSAADGSVDPNLLSTRKRKVDVEVDVSEPIRSRTMLRQADQAKGLTHQADVIDPNGSGVVGSEADDQNYWIPDPVVVPFLEPAYVVGQAGEANDVARQADVVNPNGASVGVEVGVSELHGSGSVAGEVNEVDVVGRETDMVVFDPVVCATNQNPMELTIEEAKKYLRSENRVSSNCKVKLFGTYIL